jgi:predicted RNA-binding Zn ribbon-like protein
MNVTGTRDQERLPGAPALLELLNSSPLVDGVQVDHFDDTARAGTWLRAQGGEGTRAELEIVREARRRLQAVVRGEKSPTVLAEFLDEVTFVAALSDQGIRWELDISPVRAVAARAVIAWSDVQRQSPGRLRPCSNADCRRFLLDRGTANRARWCSMAACGNRMKARRHHQRHAGRNTEASTEAG